MNQKQAKRLRQLVRHLTASGKIESKGWLVYSQDSRYEEIQVPDLTAKKEFDESGELIPALRSQLVAVGTRRMDESCGRAIYQSMKKHARSSK